MRLKLKTFPHLTTKKATISPWLMSIHYDRWLIWTESQNINWCAVTNGMSVYLHVTNFVWFGNVTRTEPRRNYNNATAISVLQQSKWPIGVKTSLMFSFSISSKCILVQKCFIVCTLICNVVHTIFFIIFIRLPGLVEDFFKAYCDSFYFKRFCFNPQKPWVDWAPIFQLWIYYGFSTNMK